MYSENKKKSKQRQRQINLCFLSNTIYRLFGVFLPSYQNTTWD